MAEQSTKTQTGGVHFDQVGDSVRDNFIAGRDIVFGKSPSFFTPDYSRFNKSKVGFPPIVSSMVDRLKRNRFVVVSGQIEIDLDEIIRQCAWQCSTDLKKAKDQNRASGRYTDLQVKEWDYSFARVNLHECLAEKTPTLFVLPNISRNQIAQPWIRVKSDLEQSTHYVILSTRDDINESSMYILGEDTYPEWYLLDLAIEKFNRSPVILSLLGEVGATPESCIWNQITIAELCKKFTTPNHIDLFINRVLAVGHTPNKPKIHTIIEQVTDDERYLEEWLDGLDKKQQLFALILVMFSGLSDDQLFAATEALVLSRWRKREPDLAMYDYGDLRALEPVVQLIESEDGIGKIKFQNDRYRFKLLKLMWNTHRQYIKISLPVLYKIAIESIGLSQENNTIEEGDFYRHELYFHNESQRLQLRTTISWLLGNVGFLSFSTVEKYLLKLAIYGGLNDQAQIMVADSLLSFAEKHHGKTEQLFRILHGWQMETKLAEVESLWSTVLGSSVVDVEKLTSIALIRSTIAVVFAYATLQADIYSEEHFSLKLDLLESLENDPSELVRQRFREFTWPIAVIIHATATKHLIENFILNPTLILPTGYSLAVAYQSAPDQVGHMLETWWRESKELPVTHKGEWPPKWREAMMATLASVYVFMLHTNSELFSQNNVQILQNRIYKIFAEGSEHEFVRRFAFIALRQIIEMGAFAPSSAEIVASIVPMLTEVESTELVKCISSIYVTQRQQLPNGENSIWIDYQDVDATQSTSVNIPIWISEPRPLTEVETQLYNWLRLPNHAALQQFVLECQVMFATLLDKEESEKLKQVKKESRSESKQPLDARKEQHIREVPKEVLGIRQSQFKNLPNITGIKASLIAVISFLRFGPRPEISATVKNLIPEILRQDGKDRHSLLTALTIWSDTKDPQLQQLGSYFNRVLPILRASNTAILSVLGVIGIIILLLIMFF